MKAFILAGVFSLLAAVAGVVSRVVLKKKPDNFIEEFAEKVIEDQTGLKVDLSPDNGQDPDGVKVIDFSGVPAKFEELNKEKI